VSARHRPPDPSGLDRLGRGQASWFWLGQAGEVEPDNSRMWQCGHHSSCSNGGAGSDNRMGLAYCSRSWGRLDSGICEPLEYDEAHK